MATQKRKELKSMIDQFKLETDGVIEFLFHLLWVKDPLFHNVPQIHIPDSIIIQYDIITDWYFMMNKEVKKKSKHKLNKEHIKEVFIKKKPPCGIVACFMRYHIDPTKQTRDISFEYFDEQELSKEIKVKAKVQIYEASESINWDQSTLISTKVQFISECFVYLKICLGVAIQQNDPIVKVPQQAKIFFSLVLFLLIVKFLDSRNEGHLGVLQRFIEPKGLYNSMIKSIWSPKACFFEKVEGLTKINSRGKDVYDRALTFEAEDFHSQEVPIRGYILPNTLKVISQQISNHIRNCSFDRLLVNRLALHFKIDSKGTLWLLFCSHMRLDKTKVIDYKDEQKEVFSYGPKDFVLNEKPLNTKFVKKPENIQTDIIKGSATNMHKTCECTNCKKKLIPSRTYEITYDMIIKGFSFDRNANKGEQQLGIRKAEPESLQEYIENFVNYKKPQKDELNPKLTHEIPPIIKKAHPTLTSEMFNKLKKDPEFQKITILVCENCLLILYRCFEGYVSGQSILAPDMVGQGRRRPDILQARHNLTKKNLIKQEENDIQWMDRLLEEANEEIFMPTTDFLYERTNSQAKISQKIKHWNTINMSPNNSKQKLLQSDGSSKQFFEETQHKGTLEDVEQINEGTNSNSEIDEVKPPSTIRLDKKKSLKIQTRFNSDIQITEDSPESKNLKLKLDNLAPFAKTQYNSLERQLKGSLSNRSLTSKLVKKENSITFSTNLNSTINKTPRSPAQLNNLTNNNSTNNLHLPQKITNRNNPNNATQQSDYDFSIPQASYLQNCLSVTESQSARSRKSPVNNVIKAKIQRDSHLSLGSTLTSIPKLKFLEREASQVSTSKVRESGSIDNFDKLIYKSPKKPVKQINKEFNALKSKTSTFWDKQLKNGRTLKLKPLQK